MIKEIQLEIGAKFDKNFDVLKKIISKKLQLKQSDIKYIEVLKRSIDARQKKIKINLKLKFFMKRILLKKMKNSLFIKM